MTIRHRFSSSLCKIKACCNALARASFRLRTVDLTRGGLTLPRTTGPDEAIVLVRLEIELDVRVALGVRLALKATGEDVSDVGIVLEEVEWRGDWAMSLGRGSIGEGRGE